MSYDDGDDRAEIAAYQLFSKFDRHAYPVPDGKIQALQLDERLTPDDFERLIARLANPPDVRSVKAHRLGKRGSKQGGVDVVVLDPLAHKCDYYEGKRVQHIAKGQITAWVERFLSGEHAGDARKFFLCTTYEVFQSTELASEWKRCAARLARDEIDSELWDGQAIQTLLRYRRDIVSELFGDSVADRYCAPTLVYPAPPERTFDAQRVSESGRSLHLQNVSVACEVLLPCDSEFATGAILSFARRDLSGISIAVPGQELVRWMQWRAHAQHDAKRPYAIAMLGDEGKVILTANSARLSLHPEEIEHFDWVLRKAWESFRRNAGLQLTRLRCAHFKRLHGSSGPFVLASVKRSMWQAMMEYVAEHDFAAGNSAWHIFDSAPGCLKVYTPLSTERFDRGYHAILYAYEEGGIWLPWGSNVNIGWTPPNDFGPVEEVSARANWDAQYTHDWLLEQFVPEVLRWVETKRANPNISRLWRPAPRPASSPADDVGRYATSSAVGPKQRSVPTDFEGLRDCVGELQSHFNARRTGIDVEPSVGRAVVGAIDRALSFADLKYEGYLRGSLSMSGDTDLVETVRARSRHADGAISQTEMDFMLRGLLEVLDAVRIAPPGEWRNIASMLQPLLDRCSEDLMCDLYAADRL